MASELNQIITAERFNELKEKVKNECLRRKYVGSVAEYGGSQYDFTVIPQTDNQIRKEHYEKINFPLGKINTDGLPSSDSERIVKDEDLLTMETKIELFSKRSIQSSAATDCASLCTGTCTDTCTTGCRSGCSGGCESGCSGSCGSACSNDCTGNCTDACTNACDTNCTSGCGVGCSGQCVTSCSSAGSPTPDCSNSCGNRCGDGDGFVCVGTCKMGCGTSCGGGNAGYPDACGNQCKVYY